MKKLCLAVLSIALFAKGFALSLITEDYSKAQNLSQEYQMPLVLLFTGSDWSDESQEMLKEFDQKADLIGRDFVLTWIDFPELNTKPSNCVQLNYALKEQYKVRSFPMLVLLNQEGEEITRLGFPLEEDIGSMIRHKFHLYEGVLEDWVSIQKKQDEARLLSCYKKLQRLNCERLQEEITHFAEKHHLCPELLFDRYVSLINGGKEKEAKLLRPYLREDAPLKLFDSQSEDDAVQIQETLKQISMTSP